VVVASRGDRPQLVEQTLVSILANTYHDFELILVDQSKTGVAAAIADRLGCADPRVRSVRDDRTGASRARNLGAAMSQGELLVFIDDDCEAAPEWLATILGGAPQDPGIGIICGAVIAAPCDPSEGFVVGYLPGRRRRLTGRLSKLFDTGITGNMTLRRCVFEEVGGFDEMLGAGAYFPAMEDQELTYRVLAAKYALLHLPEAKVVHHGMRGRREAGKFIRRTYVGIAAAYTKHLRCRDPVALLLLVQQGWLASSNIAEHLLRLRRPWGFGRFGGLLVGVVRSFELGIEANRVLYRPNRLVENSS